MNLHIFLSGIENETRLFKEARYTIEQGIFDRVVVLGTWANGLLPQEITSYGLEIHRLTLWIRRYGQTVVLQRFPLLRKLVAGLSLLQFLVLTIIQARRLRPSHISCHNVMLLPAAWAAARLSGSHLVYTPHELETRRSGVPPVMQRVEAHMERLFIHAASHVVVVCEPIADWYRSQYGLTNVHVVRNVPERDAVEVKAIPSGDFRRRFNIPQTAKVFIYQGMFGKPRGTDRLLEIFSRIDPQVAHLVLMGFGEAADQAEIDAAVERFGNIHFQPAVAREWIISYTSGADVGLLIVKDAPLSYRYALPNKFFESAHAGVPILVSNNFEYLAKIVETEGIGWSAPFGEIESLILALTEVDLTPYRARAQAFASSATWETDAAAFAGVYGSGSVQGLPR